MLARTPTPEKLSSLNELEVSRAAEFLVCADLSIQGYHAFMAGSQLPYDVVVDMGDRLLKLQVKATRGQQQCPQRATHTPRYLFQVRRCGKGGRRSYGPEDFDALALVALDIGVVAYMPLAEVRQTINLRPPGCTSTPWARRQNCISDYSWESLLRRF